MTIEFTTPVPHTAIFMSVEQATALAASSNGALPVDGDAHQAHAKYHAENSVEFTGDLVVKN